MGVIKRKKILWVSHLIPYPPKGGVLQRAYNLLKQVSRYHDVYVFAFNQAQLLKDSFPNEPDPISESISKLSEFCKAIKVVPIESEMRRMGKFRLAARSLVSTRGYTERWLHSAVAEAALLDFTSGHQFDIVHFDTISLAHLKGLVESTSTVLDHHNIESSMLYRRAKKESSLLKKIYFYQEAIKLRFYERRVCNTFTCHIVCSDDDMKRLLEIDGTLDVRLVPNGVDVEYFRPSNAEKFDEILFAGGLSWYPNLDAMNFFAAEIWPLLKKSKENLVMNLIGKNPTPYLVDFGRSDANFIVHGFLDDFRPIASRCKVYVCPIRDGGGTKLKVLDAFALGIPMVAHPLAVEGIDVEDGVHVMLASTAEEFSSAVLNLLEDVSVRDKISIAARKLVEDKYSFESIGENLSSIYGEI